MLALPIHRAEGVDLVSPITAFFKTQEGVDASRIGEDVALLNQIRSTAIVSNEPTESTWRSMLRYHHHLSSVAVRFASYEAEVGFKFAWMDPFRPSQRLTSSSIYFEWACVLWNMAALETQRAARCDRQAEEGIRAACKSLQQAAGILDYIRDHFLSHFSGGRVKSGTALTEDGVSVAKAFVCAQAQACFYEKAVLDKKTGSMKASIVAKLAQQGTVYYNVAGNACKAGVMASALDNTWSQHARYQSLYFAGAAEYWAAMGAKEAALARGSGYGEEVVRLTRCEGYLTQAVGAAKQANIPVGVYCIAETLHRNAGRSKALALKDIQTVYMEVVPADNTAAPVAPISMVRPTMALDYVPEGGGEEKMLFQQFMPKQVVQLVASFRDAAGALNRATFSEVSKATNDARSALSAVGLPGSLESYKVGGGLPTPLWHKITRIQSMGGLDELRRKMRVMRESADECANAMKGVETALVREEAEDEAFRKRCITYKGTPSSSLAIDIRSHRALLQQAHTAAVDSDRAFEGDMHDGAFQEGMGRLALPKDQLAALLPKPSPGKDADMIDTTELEGLLVQMASLLDAREATMKSVSAFADEVAQKSSAGSGSEYCAAFLKKVSAGQSEEQVLQEAMAPGNDLVGVIKNTIERQTALLPNVLKANEAFVEARKRSESGLAVERDAIIKGLEQTIAKYFELNSQITAGLTFYTNLQSQITTLLQSANDMGYSQQLLRNDFESGENATYDRMHQEMKDLEVAREMEQSFAREEEERKRQAAAMRAGDVSTGQGQSPAQSQYPTPAASRSTSATNPFGPGPYDPAVPPAGYPTHAQQPAYSPHQPPVPPKPTGYPSQTQAQYPAQQYPHPGAAGAPGAGPGPSGGVPGSVHYDNPYYSPQQPQQQHHSPPQGSMQSLYGQTQAQGQAQGQGGQQYGQYGQYGQSGPYGQGGAPQHPPASQYPPAIPPNYRQQGSYGAPQQQQSQPYAPYGASAGAGAPTAPGQAPGRGAFPPAPTQQVSSALPPPLDEGKIRRLMEMGFPRDAVCNALASCQQNEDMAVSMLLSAAAGDTSAPNSSSAQAPATASAPFSAPPAGPATGTASSAPAPAAESGKSGGIFGKIWGK